MDIVREELKRDTDTSRDRPLQTSSPRDLSHQIVSFGVVGVVSTVAYYVLYLACRLIMGPQPSNLLSLPITQVWNTSANRRHTFGVRTRKGMVRDQLSGLLAANAVATLVRFVTLRTVTRPMVTGVTTGEEQPAAGQ
ncbi:GtrA family protein [Cutibacterium sp. V947]|uniref:GtrA family protein n=1 Tax=Cutibacterium sp. V947 TaxID=3446480 RepID=UPI003EE0CA4B